MDKKIFLAIAFAFILLLPLLSAAEISPVKVDTCANLYTTCDDCSYVNISSIVVQGKIDPLVTNIAMTKSGRYYNYTFCNTHAMGTYTYNTYGDCGGGNCSEPVTFDVTPTGVVQSSVLENPILIILFVISLILTFLGFYVKSPPLVFLAGILLAISGVYTMIYGFNNYTDLYTRGAAIVIIALGAIFTIASGYEWMQEFGSDEGKEEGESKQEMEG